MTKKLVLVHTINNFKEIIYDPFGKPFADGNKDIEVYNICDDSLLKATLEAGYCPSSATRRIYNYVMSAVELGADCVMLTCTSIFEAAKLINPISPIPVFDIAEPTVKAAVEAGKKIGILATLSTSPKAIISMINDEAQRVGKEIEIVTRVSEGAFDVLCDGDRDKHDEMVNNDLFELAKEVDVIIFAQISMSLLKHEDCGVPLFKIGKDGFNHAKDLINNK